MMVARHRHTGAVTLPPAPKCSFASDNFAGAHPHVLDALTAANTGHDSSRPSTSTNTTRPGCSDCADRTNPHTAAPAKSLTSSPGKATAPTVHTINTPGASAPNHDCTTPNTR